MHTGLVEASGPYHINGALVGEEIFNGEVIGKNVTQLNKLTANLAITLFDSHVKDISTKEGSVTWYNSEKKEPACNNIFADSFVDLKNIIAKGWVGSRKGFLNGYNCDVANLSCATHANVKKVTGVKIQVLGGPLLADECQFSGECRAKGEMVLTNSKIQSLRLFPSETGKTSLILTDTEIEGDVIFEAPSLPKGNSRVIVGGKALGDYIRFDGLGRMARIQYAAHYPEGTIALFDEVRCINKNGCFVPQFEVEIQGNGVIKGNVVFINTGDVIKQYYPNLKGRYISEYK